MKKNTLRNQKVNLDKIDRDIICLLQKNGRLSNTKIAKKLGISESTVRIRLKRIIEEEYIQLVAVSNPIKLGFKIIGIIRYHIEIGKTESITNELKKLKPIWFIVHTTGATDIYTEFVVRSLEELDDLIYNKINKIDGVIRTETSLILKFIKRKYDWGTAMIDQSED